MRFQMFLSFTIIIGLTITSEATAQPADFSGAQRHFVAFGHTIDKSNGGDNGSEGRQNAFVGLWQALDSSDGSTQYLSITCSHPRSCDVRLNDTAFTTSCQNQIGFAQGEGSIRGRTLKSDLTLSCSNLDGTSTIAGSQINEFVLDPKNGTLTNINDDPVPVPNVFHRISK